MCIVQITEKSFKHVCCLKTTLNSILVLDGDMFSLPIGYCLGECIFEVGDILQGGNQINHLSSNDDVSQVIGHAWLPSGSDTTTKRDKYCSEEIFLRF